MSYRCYFLDGDSIVSAMYAHVETEELAVRLATAAYQDKLWSPLIDGLEIWCDSRLGCKIPLHGRSDAAV